MDANKKSLLPIYIVGLFTFALPFIVYVWNGVHVFLINFPIFHMLGGIFLILGLLLAKLHKRLFVISLCIFFICKAIGFILDSIKTGVPQGFLPVFLLSIVGVGIGVWYKKQFDKSNRRQDKGIVLIALAIILSIYSTLTFWEHMDAHPFGNNNIPSLTLSDLNRPALTLRDLGIETQHRSFTYKRHSIAVPVYYMHYESGHSRGATRTFALQPVSEGLARLFFERYARQMETRFVRFIRGRCPCSYFDTITRLNADEASFWGADKGVWVYHNSCFFDCYHGSSRDRAELLLLRGRTIFRLRIYHFEDGICIETFNQAVHALWEAF